MNRYIMALFFLLVPQDVRAADLNFITTTEEIIDGLTSSGPGQGIRTRSLRRPSPTRTRSIRVVREERGKVIEGTVKVSEEGDAQRVNLKIEFDVDSYSIRPESYGLLEALGRALTSNKLEGRPLSVRGHTDSDGDDEHNLRLSLKRAIAVKSYLLSSFAIAPGRIQVIGCGEGVPLVPNTDERNRQINRRVEISATPLDVGQSQAPQD